MKKIIMILEILLLSAVLVLAIENHQSEIEEGKKLVESKISCDELTNEQLEEMGDYYMEQMHPGESHEMMHDMMGGHDSETTKLMHINMAKGIYCKENINMMNGGMMGGNMMNGQTPAQTNMMQGMMGNWGYSYGYWSFVNILSIILLIELIILVFLWITKLWKDKR